MPNTASVLIPHVDVGTPPSEFTNYEVTTVEVRFHEFEDLPTTRDVPVKVKSPRFTCFGHQWKLYIYPGGDEYADHGKVSVTLVNLSNKEIVVSHGFCVNSGNLGETTHWHDHNRFAPSRSSSCDRWGVSNFAKRSKLLNQLVDGTLVIEVKVQLSGDDCSNWKASLPFIPENPLRKNVLNKFMDESSADVVFEVHCEQNRAETETETEAETDSNKRAKLSPETFYAHRLVLLDSSSTLAELCKSGGDNNMKPLQINHVKPGIFTFAIPFIWGEGTRQSFEVSCQGIDRCSKLLRGCKSKVGS